MLRHIVTEQLQSMGVGQPAVAIDSNCSIPANVPLQSTAPLDLSSNQQRMYSLYLKIIESVKTIFLHEYIFVYLKIL